MKKKVLSIILTVVIIINCILTVILGAACVVAICSPQIEEVDSSGDLLPGASVIGVLLAYFAIVLGLMILEFMIASVGFLASVVNFKIAPHPILQKASLIAAYFFGAIIVLLTVIFACGVAMNL